MPTTNNNAYAYNPYALYQQPQPQMPQPQNAQSHNNITWVQGIEGARAYPVSPGQAIALWDSESSTIYIKMADASGVPQPLRILDYTERAQATETDAKEYVTADQLNDILDQKFAALTTALQQRPNNQRGGKNNERGQNSKPNI